MCPFVHAHTARARMREAKIPVCRECREIALDRGMKETRAAWMNENPAFISSVQCPDA